MALLFTDSTYDLSIGLLSEELKWLEHRAHSGQKASAILQNETFSLCQAQGIKPQDLKGVITVAGPGFYTGLRLSEGFADIFKVFGIPCYSFYSYEIPRFCGFSNGVWMTKAYRGEYFFHEWDGEKSANTLIPTKDLTAYLEKFEHVFIHSLPSIDQVLKNYTSTIDLLKQKPEIIFKEVIQNNMHHDSFYFRAPEDEFRVSI